MDDAIFTCVLLDRIRRTLFAAKPVLEGEGSDPDAIQVTGGVDALGVKDQLAVTATRADDDGRARRLFLGGQEHGDRGVVDVLDPVALGELGLGSAGSQNRAPRSARAARPGARPQERQLLAKKGTGREAARPS